MKKKRQVLIGIFFALISIFCLPEKVNSDENKQWYLQEIGLPEEVQDKGEDKEDIIIAVIDTGVDSTHRALKDSLWINEAEFFGEDSVDDDGNGYIDDIYGYDVKNDRGDISDFDGHGTKVAGIIGMKPTKENKSRGVFPDAKIMVIKAGDSCNGFSTENLMKALRYARENNADIINMSLGTTYCSDELIEELELAAEHAVLVAAAGNDSAATAESGFYGAVNIFPAGLPMVLGVMSSDREQNLAYFSNWDYAAGTEVDYEIIAPGQDIYVTVPGQKYGYESGTSMSAAIVSGACGILMQELKGSDEYSPELIRQDLLSNQKDYIKMTDVRGKLHTFTKLNIEYAKKQIEEEKKKDINELEKLEESEEYIVKTPKNLSYKDIDIKKINSKKETFEKEKKKIMITWDQEENVIGYEISFCKKKKGKYQLIKRVNKNSCKLKKRKGFYKVRAYKKRNGEKVYSEYTKSIQIL